MIGAFTFFEILRQLLTCAWKKLSKKIKCCKSCKKRTAADSYDEFSAKYSLLEMTEREQTY